MTIRELLQKHNGHYRRGKWQYTIMDGTVYRATAWEVEYATIAWVPIPWKPTKL